jgi:lipoprotein-releasing system ATP-binding protein
MSLKTMILEAKQLTKRFILPDKSKLTVLQKLSMKVEKKSVLAITGVSGSGKSTLLHLIGGLDRPDRGEILFKGRSILEYSEKERALYRNQKIGFVYQFHYLMPELNVIENVAFPYLMGDFDREAAFSRASKLLAAVGLKNKELIMPYQLSGGERQRVAIARSLINSPELLLADEPTGNLDWKTGEKVFRLFRELIAEKELTAIMATHNEQLAKLVDRRLHLQAGELIEVSGNH